MEINQTKTVPVEAKTLKLNMKVCDQFRARLYDQDDMFIGEYEGYVPAFMPGQHFGDYLRLDINIDTGQITNWVKPEPELVEEIFCKQEEED